MPTTWAELTLLRRATFPRERLMIGDSIISTLWLVKFSDRCRLLAGNTASVIELPTGVEVLNRGEACRWTALSPDAWNAVRAKQWASRVPGGPLCLNC